MKSVELFAGAGGLAIGAAMAGLETHDVVERDRWACDTVRHNQARHYPVVSDWGVRESDIRHVDWVETQRANIDVVTGGPPCQPFSMGGRARAADDDRDMFPAATEVIRLLRPKAFVLENVKGLTRGTFSNYFQYVQLRLRFPELRAKENESWTDHFTRLQMEHTSEQIDLCYNVVPTLVNAAAYGVPQQRHRVFLIGFRNDLDAEWAFPEPTHSRESLINDKWVTGEYWERHQVPKRLRVEDVPPSEIQKVKATEDMIRARPWRTVRDAVSDLPKPTTRGSRMHMNHVLQLGARSYVGHTGSPIDQPAKALKAGDHGVPGGENMIRLADDSVRYFTIREAARLQTFPDGYELRGSWTEAMRQLGNAVPVWLAQQVMSSVVTHLALADIRAKTRQHPRSRSEASAS